MVKRPRVQLIANPVAGRNAVAMIAEAERYLMEQGAEVKRFLTSGRGDAERFAALAVADEFDRVVVAGGDGTVNEVLNGLGADAPPLAVLAVGTTNVLALETKLPLGLAAACDLALNGVPTPIHLGLAGGRRFALMVGIGFDATVVRDVDLGLKRAWGKGAYLLSAWRAWWQHADRPLQVTDAQGEVHQGFQAIIGNARCYGGRFTLTPAASLFADRLDLCLISRPGRLALLLVGLALLTGRPLALPWGRHLQGQRFTLSGPDLPVQIDGDPAGTLPLVVTMNPFPIRMMLPR